MPNRPQYQALPPRPILVLRKLNADTICFQSCRRKSLEGYSIGPGRSKMRTSCRLHLCVFVDRKAL